MDASEKNVLSNANNVARELSEEIQDHQTNESDGTSKELQVTETKANNEPQDINEKKNTELIDNKKSLEKESTESALMDVDTNSVNQKQITNLEQEITDKTNDMGTPKVVESEKYLSTEIISAGLNLLSQYDSDVSDNGQETGDAKTISKDDSDVESVIEIGNVNVNDYRNKVVELSSDSDDSSSSSDSSTISAVDGEKEARSFKHLRKAIDKSIADGGSDDDDEDDEEDENGLKKIKRRVPPKVKGEMLLEDLPPIEDLHITVPEDECIELGRVHSIVDQLLLVSVLPNSLLLDLDTVLFLDKGKRVLGAVFDVLGPVAGPLYCVRFNSNAQIHEKQINVDDVVYVAPKTEYTQFVILSSLMKIRGSDASWENDVEPPQRFLDYSDDEQERQARARLRNKDRQEPAENHLHNKRSNNNNDDSCVDDSDTMSTMSDSTVTSQSTSGHWRGGRARGGRARNGKGREMSTFSPNVSAPPMLGNIPNYAPNYMSNYDNSSWHANLNQPQPYAFRHYGNMPPPPPGPGMGYYQYVPPPFAYGANYMPYPPPPQQMQQWRPPMPRQPPGAEHNK